MSIKNLAFAGSALATLAIASAAHAQPPTAVDAVDELLVTGISLEQTVPLELSRQGHDLVIIDGETVENRGYVDLPAALQMEINRAQADRARVETRAVSALEAAAKRIETLASESA